MSHHGTQANSTHDRHERYVMSQVQPRIAIIGKGALGLMFADIVCKHLGHDAASFVVSEERLSRDKHRDYRVNNQVVNFRTETPEHIATLEGSVELIIVATKAPALGQALPLIEPLLSPTTCIISILNGITSEQEIAKVYGWEHVCGAIAQGMDAMRIGSDMSYSNPGEIRIGPLENTPHAIVSQVASVLSDAHLPFSQWDDILYRMWVKLMLNVGINQVCFAFDATYGDVIGSREDGTYHANKLFMLFVAAMREVIAVAKTEGIDIQEEDLWYMVTLMEGLDLNSRPSMGQDRLMHNPTEVDSFAGEVCRRAHEHNILVPTNEFLLQRIRSIEDSWKDA